MSESYAAAWKGCKDNDWEKVGDCQGDATSCRSLISPSTWLMQGDVVIAVPAPLQYGPHRLSDILCDCRVMAQKILCSIFACLPCKMHRPIWAEHQPRATSPCPPPLYQYMSSSFRTFLS